MFAFLLEELSFLLLARMNKALFSPFSLFPGSSLDFFHRLQNTCETMQGKGCQIFEIRFFIDFVIEKLLNHVEPQFLNYKIGVNILTHEMNGGIKAESRYKFTIPSSNCYCL